MKLHKHQEALLNLLKENGGDLTKMTLRAMGREIGVEDRAQVIVHHLEQLENKGFIRRREKQKRVYDVLQVPVKSVVFVDLYSTTAQCGPDGFLGDDCVEEQIPIASKQFGVTNPDDYFFVKARGNSMETTISEGDLVLARRQNDVDSGQIAVIVHQGESKIKKVVKSKNGYVLVSLNPAVTDEAVLPVEGSELRICGLVRGIMKLS